MPLLALPFPPIDPVLVSIGPLTIRWYGLAYVAGLLLGWLYLRTLINRERLWGGQAHPDARRIDDLLMYITFGVILGGRIGYVLFYSSATYLADPLSILKLWQGGMSFHGGLLGAIAAMILFARRHRLALLTLFDLVASAVPIGLFFGRLANFINGELYGRITDVPWAIVFPQGGMVPRHPSQLYEALLEGAVLFALLALLTWRYRALHRPGLLAGVFGIGYGASRIFVEFYREPDPQIGYLAFDHLTMGMLLSLPLLVFGVTLLLRALYGKKGSP